jgi:hypothetical protein
MLHELWVDLDGLDMYCLAGPQGDAVRALLPKGSTLETVFEANSHFEAMTKYYEYRGYGVYRSNFPNLDKAPYVAIDAVDIRTWSAIGQEREKVDEDKKYGRER